MKLSILSVALLFFLFNRCSNSSADENLIDKYYSNNEIEELDKIKSFVINQMSKNCTEKSVECLYDYFQQFKDLRPADEVELGFSRDAQKILIESLDEQLFDDIWGYCVAEAGTLASTKFLCINTNGRFSKFLAELTSDNEKLKRYGETLQLAGAYTPFMDVTLLKQTERFNLHSRNEMLIVAIHLFTLNYSESLN